MKNIFRGSILSLFLLIATGFPVFCQNPDGIAVKIFLGQAYPSGKVYLRPFPIPGKSLSENDYLKSFVWPKFIKYRSLSGSNAYAAILRECGFIEAMHDGEIEIEPGVSQVQSAYIPGLECMDDFHEGCTKKFYRPKNPRYKYLGRDFFEQILDNCNSNEGTAIYKSNDTGVCSFMVIAYDPGLQVSNIELSEGKVRPLTLDESKQLEKEKAEGRRNKSDCTTEPVYIDSAYQLLNAKLGGTDFSIRISQYVNPGCMGHLAKIFILDIIKSGVLLKKYELVQYEGAI